MYIIIIILCSPSYNTGAIRENENNEKSKNALVSLAKVGCSVWTVPVVARRRRCMHVARATRLERVLNSRITRAVPLKNTHAPPRSTVRVRRGRRGRWRPASRGVVTAAVATAIRRCTLYPPLWHRSVTFLRNLCPCILQVLLEPRR